MTGTSKVFVCTGDGTIRTFKEEGVAGSVPVKDKDFTYSGNCEVIDDTDEVSGVQWRIKFLTSGVLVFANQQMIDLFLMGGGGGSHSTEQGETSGTRGGTSSAFNITAAGGYSASLRQGSSKPYSRRGGNGGSGGGGGGLSSSGNLFPFGCGGDGGYTTTQKSIYLEKNKSYSIVIGDGGTGTKRYTNIIAPSGGSGIVIIRNHRE